MLRPLVGFLIGGAVQAEPNFKLLGARLKGDQKNVVDYLKTQVSEAELEQFLAEGASAECLHSVVVMPLTIKGVTVYEAALLRGNGVCGQRFCYAVVMLLGGCVAVDVKTSRGRRTSKLQPTTQPEMCSPPKFLFL